MRPSAPHQLRPERWLDLDRASTPRYCFFPICVGERFAMTEAIAALSIIARRRDISPTQSDLAKLKPSDSAPGQKCKGDCGAPRCIINEEFRSP